MPKSARERLRLLPVETLVYESPLMCIGAFRCPTADRHFLNTNPIPAHTIVFPRTTVRIRHHGREGIVAGPNVVTYYNEHQTYSRSQVAPDGDRSDWFVLAPSALQEIVRCDDPSVDDRPDEPFEFSHGPSDAQSYVLQRRAFEHARTHTAPDSLFVEELALAAVARVVQGAQHAWRARLRTRRGSIARHTDLIERTKAFLALRVADLLSLGQIAEAVESSEFHLTRVFHAGTGMPLHAYRTQLRLRASLERVIDPRQDLTTLALDLGFSSHSHFSYAFRRAFGLTPSAFRRERPYRRQLHGDRN